jgi:branched-chain amino acid transport system substrate-binding protein
MFRKTFVSVAACVAAFLVAPAAAQAPKELKVGFVSTLSGPAGGIGVELRDGFNLAIKMAGGRLGGMPTEVVFGDDQLNPEVGKQLAERMVRRDRVHLMTGIVFSNVMLAVWPTLEQAKMTYISMNATPTAISGKGCSPFFLSASWPNEAYHEAAGHFASGKGYKSAYLIAPNYPAGKDATSGFKRGYKGSIAAEVYTKLNQLDYAAELAQIRAAAPQAVYAFLPGGMGINFIKQFNQAGLAKDIQLVVPGFTSDQDVVRAVGDAMIGLVDTAHWSYDLENEANKRFVAAFEKEYNRMPTVFSEQGYTTALLIDAAVRAVKGNVTDPKALQAALRGAPGKFQSPRGDWKIAANGTPVQAYYLRELTKDGKGRIVNRKIDTIMTEHVDFWAKECPMK